MTPNGEVKLVDGKLVKTGKPSKAVAGKPPKYPYPLTQYDSLLKIAKSDGLETGDTKAKNTATVNIITGLVIDAFIADRARTKS